jgi:hypothetical protein
MSDLTLAQLKAQVHATLGTESAADIKDRYPSWVADLKLNTKDGWATLLTRLQEWDKDQDEVAGAPLPEQPAPDILDELASLYSDLYGDELTDNDITSDFADLSLEQLFAQADEISSHADPEHCDDQAVALPLAIAVVEFPLEPANLPPKWWFVTWVWVEAIFYVIWSDFVLPGLRAATRSAISALQSAFWFALQRGLPWLRRQIAESWYRLRLVTWLYQNRDQLLRAILH